MVSAVDLVAQYTFGWQSTFFVMAMLTVPVLIFVRIGLAGVQLESKASGEKVSQEARRAARRGAVRQPAFLDDLRV